MKKLGFTLIELLAVILILGIIALIAIPTVNNIIKESKRGAFKTGVQNIIQAAEQQCQVERLSGSEITSIYTFYNGEVTPNIDLKGSLPSTGTIKVDDECNISFDNITDGTYSAVKEKNAESITLSEKENRYLTYANGTAIYFNPNTGKKCSLKDAVSTTLTKEGCMKWYIFNDSDGSETVNALLDHNIAQGIWWNSTESTVAPKEAQEELIANTNNWINGLNQRLISATEVATIVGSNSFNPLSTAKEDSLDIVVNYGWLLDNTKNCKGAGCYIEDNYDNHSCESCHATGLLNNGYWTSTGVSGFYSINGSPIEDAATTWAWAVSIDTVQMKLYYNRTLFSEIGVRPVITINKSIIS